MELAPILTKNIKGKVIKQILNIAKQGTCSLINTHAYSSKVTTCPQAREHFQAESWADATVMTFEVFASL